jgi:hypothetical protein
MESWWIGAAGLSVCAALLALDPSPRPSTRRPSTQHPRHVPRISQAAIMTGAFLFIYVATEHAVSGWVASLALRDRTTAQFWAAAPSIFWAGVLTGRAITPGLLKKRSPVSVVFAGLALAAAGAFILILTRTPALELTAGRDLRHWTGANLSAGGRTVRHGRRQLSRATRHCVRRWRLGRRGGSACDGQISGSLRTGLAIALSAIAAMAWLQKKLAPPDTLDLSDLC